MNARMNYRRLSEEMRLIVDTYVQHYKSDLKYDLARIENREPGDRFIWATYIDGTGLVNLNAPDAAYSVVGLRENTGYRERIVFIIRVIFDGEILYDMTDIDSRTFGEMVYAGFIPAALPDLDKHYR